MVSGCCSGCTSRICGSRETASDTAGLYFMVQVPNRLTPIMPSVCCDSRR